MLHAAGPKGHFRPVAEIGIYNQRYEVWVSSLQAILLEQRDLNQQLQARLRSSGNAAVSHTVGDMFALQQQVAALQSQNAELQQRLQSGADPAAGAQPAARRQRLAAPSAAGSTRRKLLARSADGSASAADMISSLPHDAAELATLQQRIGYLEAQNATLRAAAAGAEDAAAAAVNSAPAAASNITAAGDSSAEQQLRAALEADAAASGIHMAAATGLPPQLVRWEEQRKLQRQIDNLRSKLRVSSSNAA